MTSSPCVTLLSSGEAGGHEAGSHIEWTLASQHGSPHMGCTCSMYHLLHIQPNLLNLFALLHPLKTVYIFELYNFY